MCDVSNTINCKMSKSCVSGLCTNNSVDHSITVDHVAKAVKSLRSGKSDGGNMQTSDHLIQGLLTSMLHHGCVPNNMLLSTIIPIPKSAKKSLYKSNNYRGIALGSIIGKVLDKLILDKFANLLSTSDLQYGFKPHHSTTQCTYVVKETIQYYTDRGSSVYAMLLDASQAFDRVEYVKLFKLLLQRNLCPMYARLLAVMYTNQCIRIKWGNQLTDKFTALNGVKQGGVLSPILFTIYIDVLLNLLSKSGYGCHIGHCFMGAFGYADDVVILAPTMLSLNTLLDISKEFSDEYQVLFNMDKFKFLVFGDTSNTDASINVGASVINSVTHDDHLGNTIGNKSCSVSVTKCTNDFTSKVNKLITYFDCSYHNTKYTLFQSFCMNLYGCVLWDYSSKDVNGFFIRWRKCLRRFLHLPMRTHNALLALICMDIPVEVQLHLRLLKFFINILSSDNSRTRLCGLLTLNGSLSDVSNSVNFICNLYGIDKYQLLHVPFSSFKRTILTLPINKHQNNTEF